MKAIYNFPPNSKVERDTADLTREDAILSQIDKAIEELLNARSAVLHAEGEGRILEQVADAEQALEGVQRMFADRQVIVSRAWVAIKNFERGNYIDGGEGRR
jgi:hypothetical protein